MHSVFWSAENKVLPQSRALWSTESKASNDDKISISSPFIINSDYELLLCLLPLLHSNYQWLLDCSVCLNLFSCLNFNTVMVMINVCSFAHLPFVI